ncbi:amidohydrolase family protein [Phytoactinopolyspora halotolerans]|uniref:Amidohydrolase family protein n=1 Tax=Phytoactinopolyspora halotolerans TaxID=1981512 RepID=A0A6L9S3D3_9ACTN|nr:amidohydrolase family protein [Phytoactinopolyspora halotolerans]NED99924.1 amidohydrolase family protein [Phytoactinopolyspora halotolerans]
MFAIRGARLFDGEDSVDLPNPTILIDDGRIQAIRSGTTTGTGHPHVDHVVAPDDVDDVIDLGDVTLLPGLIDTHVHLVFDAGPDPIGRLAQLSDDEALELMRSAARAHLAAGVTTVRDLGDRNYLGLRLRDELAAASTPGAASAPGASGRAPTGPSMFPAGPHVLTAGPPITTTRGHCWSLGGEADGVDGIRAAVREHAERGVDVIKVMASGGLMTEGTRSELPQYSLAELRAAADEAHRLGLPITAHAHSGQAIADVVAAGFDSIEHCSFMTEDGVEPVPDTIAAIASAGIPVSATLGMLPDLPLPPPIASRINGIIGMGRMLTEAGVTIVCGSDAGIGPPKPHGVLPHAVGQFVRELGWTPADALRAVTSHAARVCRVDGRKGRIAPGFDADLLAVHGDPLRDPSAVLDVHSVYRQGVSVAALPERT